MPRIFGHDLLAIIAAVVAIYIIGFLIYGIIFADFWISESGIDLEAAEQQQWKMAFSWIMPVLTTLALAKLFKLANADDLMSHIKIGIIAWLGFDVSTLLYGYLYGTEYPFSLIVLDSAHLLLGVLVASAILLWRKSPRPSGTESA